MIIPIPKYEEEPEIEIQVEEGSTEWVRWYLNCPSWKCDKCGTTMFGRMKYCVYCKLKLNVTTPRPYTYREEEYKP